MQEEEKNEVAQTAPKILKRPKNDAPLPSIEELYAMRDDAVEMKVKGRPLPYRALGALYRKRSSIYEGVYVLPPKEVEGFSAGAPTTLCLCVLKLYESASAPFMDEAVYLRAVRSKL